MGPIEISGNIGPNADVKELKQRVARIRKELVDATPYLASYDRRQCDIVRSAGLYCPSDSGSYHLIFVIQQLKHLDQQIQSSVAPKSRFAFKRAAPTPAIKDPPPLENPLSEATTTAVETDVPSSSPTSQLSISRRKNEILSANSLDSQDGELPAQSSLFVAHLDSCVVDLIVDKSSFQITALHIRSLKDTIVLAPVIPGSVLIHDCENCLIVVGCHQVAFLGLLIFHRVNANFFFRSLTMSVLVSLVSHAHFQEH